MRVLVDAPRDEVLAALQAAFTEAELEQLNIDPVSSSNAAFAPEPRRAEPLTTIALWFASAIGGGIAYDLTKKAATVLVNKFGPTRVKEDGTPS